MATDAVISLAPSASATKPASDWADCSTDYLQGLQAVDLISGLGLSNWPQTGLAAADYLQGLQAVDLISGLGLSNWPQTGLTAAQTTYRVYRLWTSFQDLACQTGPRLGWLQHRLLTGFTGCGPHFRTWPVKLAPDWADCSTDYLQGLQAVDLISGLGLSNWPPYHGLFDRLIISLSKMWPECNLQSLCHPFSSLLTNRVLAYFTNLQ